MKQEYSKTEDRIIKLFKDSNEFNYQGNIYKVLNIGKPRPSSGECKTDIYVLTKNVSKNKEKEFKISIKQKDADFIENRMSLDRAKRVLGNEATKIIIKSIASIKYLFEESFIIIYKKSTKSIKKNITLGWTFDLVYNKRNLGGLMLLTDHQKIDVFSGTNLNSDKKNSKVNGTIIKNSGVANHILTIEDTNNSLDFYLKSLKPIDDYAVNTNIYFACKAVNYRAEPIKWDGDRPLVVYINWNVNNKLLKSELIFDKPLMVKANMIGENIKDILRKIKIDSNNFIELKNYVDKDVKYSI